MAPTTKSLETAEKTIASFYDAFAADYDLMTGFAKRFVQEKPFFHMLVDKHKIQTALDAGCGTGFHSLLLAQLGVAVTAVDVSGEMVKRLQQHANAMHLKISTLVASFEHLPAAVDQTFDFILSMGNSLVHILTEREMLTVLKNFRGRLKPSGLLFVQTLNYDRILSQRERVQSTKETPMKTFVRFYDYAEQEILFNILTLEKSNGATKERLQTVPLRPWRRDELVGLLGRAGFEGPRVHGGVALQDFHPEDSKDLVILAKPRQ